MPFAKLNDQNIVVDIDFGEEMPNTGIWVKTIDGQMCSLGMFRLENGDFMILPSLEDTIAQVQQAIMEYAQSLLAGAVSGYSNEERDTWFGKQDEAIKYLKTRDATNAQNLAIEAEQAGLPIEVLAEIVSTKAAALRAYTSHVLGTRSRHYRAVGAMQSVANVEAYNWLEGWNFEGGQR
jgi:uncharacterized protein YgfB (UPF0149 family)